MAKENIIQCSMLVNIANTAEINTIYSFVYDPETLLLVSCISILINIILIILLIYVIIKYCKYSKLVKILKNHIELITNNSDDSRTYDTIYPFEILKK